MCPWSLDTYKKRRGCIPAERSWSESSRSAPPANMAHTRQSTPYSGLGFQVTAFKTFQVVPSWLGDGCIPAERSLSAPDDRLINGLEIARSACLSVIRLERTWHIYDSQGQILAWA